MLVIVVLMAVTWKPWFSVWDNWFSTQFAYQLPAWPAIIGFLGMLFFTINKDPKEDTGKSNLFPLLLLAGFTVIWIYIASITNYHPHTLAGAGMQVYTAIMTIAFPGCMLTFIIELLKMA